MAARNQDAKGRAVERQTEAIPANDHTAVGSVYPKVDMTDGTNSFPAMESIVQDYWNKDQTFQASLDQRKDAPEYIFYDGPPFANGLPHYGHLLTGYRPAVPHHGW